MIPKPLSTLPTSPSSMSTKSLEKSLPSTKPSAKKGSSTSTESIFQGMENGLFHQIEKEFCLFFRKSTTNISYSSCWTQRNMGKGKFLMIIGLLAQHNDKWISIHWKKIIILWTKQSWFRKWLETLISARIINLLLSEITTSSCTCTSTTEKITKFFKILPSTMIQTNEEVTLHMMENFWPF